eukprot:TRINITY_DN8791_c0_g1_i1.p1 TRINITY_DN8791_c0_g1~~TRINITY_DN8791_c0_g1_i1.p1  ORF type:complete len:411 (+),score=66.10 TRINITY_DN8791_c0_g1_i1:34-1266(+)
MSSAKRRSSSESASSQRPPKVAPLHVEVTSLATLQTQTLPQTAIRGRARQIWEFKRLNTLGEGTYGVVYRAKDEKTGAIVAAKRVKMEEERGGLPVSSLREISALQQLDHENVVKLLCVASGRSLNSVYLIMEYCEHDLATLIDNMPTPFPEPAVKCLLQQLLKGLTAMHAQVRRMLDTQMCMLASKRTQINCMASTGACPERIFCHPLPLIYPAHDMVQYLMHRDLKLSNLLLTDKGVLKIADMGLTRHHNEPANNMSPIVVTLWYRAPELLFGVKDYTNAIDLWSVGCIFAELLAHKPLFPAKSETALLELMIELLGTPHRGIWPEFEQLPLTHRYKLPQQPYSSIKDTFGYLSSDGIRLLSKLLMYDPAQRLSARSAGRHAYFRTPPLPLAPELMPTFPQHRNRLED